MRNHLIQLAALTVLTIVIATGCKPDDVPPDSWESVEMASQPTLFEIREGHPALADLEELYLGQSKKPALAALKNYCEHPVRRDSGALGGDAYFLGCRLEDGETLTYVRVGFWPNIDERVATLEIKRSPVSPAAVHRAYRDLVDEQLEETLKHQRIQITSESYRMFADWDEGHDGPVHLVVGFAPEVDNP